MKKRLDLLVQEQNAGLSREKAKALIMSGVVYINGQKEDKAGALFPEDAVVEIRGNTLKYVSRGGLKLEKALQEFGLNPAGKVCMDVGASTGGFTDCMLQNGAARVYAVDVGRGQLSWQLRQDPRVICLEKTNIRYAGREQIPEEIAFCSIDVSFISLSKVFPAVRALMHPEGEVAALIKPQFEAGREQVGKHGVVRDPAVHQTVIRMALHTAEELGFGVRGLTFSPIRGPEGNIEYLCHLSMVRGAGDGITEEQISDTVRAAHEALAKKEQAT